ncbi:MAG: UvrD-helicase domain-containing protein [Bacteroidales bacterium]|nr:UvrD-helicase domain-containing protein [Bacteroidales bacterium]
MLKILKASAGAGKTYQLALEYIRLLVREPDPLAYRHVLAVTFTNKATEEMKSRILEELYKLSKDPRKSKYLEELLKECNGSMEILQERASTQLSGILHDYSAFAVSTIDKFFQQTLRAFSREVGQFSSYQVQLDRDALVQESVDLVLDGLQESDSTLINWLTEAARGDLSRTGRFSVDANLLNMAKSLRDLPEGTHSPTHGQLRELNSICRKTIEDFQKDVAAAAQKIIDVFNAAGIDLEDTSHGWAKAVRKYLDPDGTAMPSQSFLAAAEDSSKWFAKTKDQYRQALTGHLEQPLNQFTSLFGQRFKEYNTARIIIGQIYGLGVADTLQKAFAQVQKDGNVISIDDSNAILRGIIDGKDTPFIYEKLGVRFDDFLLDEFQDTSDIQWDNFLPLIRESESTGGHSLVVGDVKQSIYRWRGSDWDLLGNRIGKQFPGAQTTALRGNHRTCRRIVEFNNRFFTHAALATDGILGIDPASEGSISSIYKGVQQEVRTEETAQGLVEVVFTKDQMEEVVRSVKALLEKKVSPGQIAVLVRKNSEGSDIASALVAENIPVVSDDSLFVKSSVTVRRLVSQMSLVATPSNPEKPSAAGFLAQELGIDIPESYHSLLDLAEGLLRDLKEAYPRTFEVEIPYIQAFMDYLKDWISTGGNNLDAFLQSWKDAEPKISSPSSGNSVRVMTIHKSKGLEFPFVIFPFAEKVTLYKASAYWCKPEGEGLEGKADGVYRVNLDSSAANSFFGNRYNEELRLQAIDNINTFYVALTRAKYGLKVIAATPPAKINNSNLSQILYGFLGTTEYREGELFVPPVRKQKEEAVILGYPSFPAGSGGRLSFSPEAADYFGQDGTYGQQASARIRGNVLHDILSSIVTEADIANVVDDNETLELLKDRISSVRERGWFSPEAKVLLEADILDRDGNLWRPDRVVLHPDGSVSVIDYKSGEPDPKYLRQVERYVNLYRAMGYQNVKGYLWYLTDNTITESSPDSRK